MDLKEIKMWWESRPVVNELRRPIFGHWVEVTDWLIAHAEELEDYYSRVIIVRR